MIYWAIIVWGLNPLTSDVADQFMDEWKFNKYEDCMTYIDKNYKNTRGPDGGKLIFVCREYTR